MNRKAPTIREVAERAGVSISTVSNVLYGKRGYYSPETAKRVWAAVQKLGYRPNHIARSLARRRTFTLGVAIEQQLANVSHNFYFGVLLDGILQQSSERDYQVKIIRVRPDAPERTIDHIEDGSVEGVLAVALSVGSFLLDHLMHSSVPAVLAGTIPPNVRLPCVDIDDLAATYEAVKWLISLGHRRIGIITGFMSHWSARRREQGYLMALREAGLTPNSAWRYEGGYLLSEGEAGMRYLLRADPRPTAVVCGNDQVAMGALRVLREAGIRVPDEMSLIGFDDMEGSALTEPPLTTIRQPVFDIGFRATELLIQQIESGQRVEQRILLPTELVVRATVAPPPPH